MTFKSNFDTLTKNEKGIIITLTVISALLIAYSLICVAEKKMKSFFVFMTTGVIMFSLSMAFILMKPTKSESYQSSCPSCKPSVKEEYTETPQYVNLEKQNSTEQRTKPSYLPKSIDNVMPINQDVATYSGNYMMPISQVILKPRFKVADSGFSIMGDSPIKYNPEVTQTTSQFEDPNNLNSGIINLNVAAPMLPNSSITPKTGNNSVFV